MLPDIGDLKDMPEEEIKEHEHSEAWKERLAENRIKMLESILAEYSKSESSEINKEEEITVEKLISTEELLEILTSENRDEGERRLLEVCNRDPKKLKSDQCDPPQESRST